METINDILREMREEANEGYSVRNAKLYFADRIEAAARALPNIDDYGRLREELRAARERRDECEAKMHKAFERVTAAEERERKLKEEVRGLQDAMGEDTLLMQARDIDRANEEIRRLREIVSRLFSKRHEEAIRQSVGSRAVIQSLKEENERLLKIKEEYENAKRNIANLRREVTLKQGQMVDMGHAYRDEIKRLKDALRPVLECEDSREVNRPFAGRAADAVHEAQRIYREGTNENNKSNENNEGKEGTDGKD